MRAIPLTVLKGGINRQRVKGGASINQLYDLQNAYITVEGSVVPREGTIRAATLDSSTVGLAVLDGVFNVFSTALQTVPAGYECNILAHPTSTSATLETIWFAKPFMGFLFVVAEFNTGDIFDYWLQNNGTWTSSSTYTSGTIVLPDTANGYAYLAVRDAAVNPTWTAQTIVATNTQVEPNEYTGFYYRAIAVAGTNPHTSSTEPVWPTVAGGTVQEFGDFDLSSTDAGTTNDTASTTTSFVPLGANITDRYGDSSTIANAGTSAGAAIVTTATVSTNVTVWQPGTNYAPGAVVRPSATQGAYIDAIPNGDFESGDDGNWIFSGAIDFAFVTTNQYQGQYCISRAAGYTATSGDYARMNNYGVVKPGQSVTATAYLNPNNSGADLEMWLCLDWYTTSGTVFLSEILSATQEGGGYRKVSVTGTAPASADSVRVAIRAGSGTHSGNPCYADLVSWSLEEPSTVSNFLYEAVQATAAASGSSQPTWPTSLNATVIDGGVTWEAIGTSIITWEAIPIMYSGTSEPAFATTIGTSVYDSSSYTDANGVVLNTSMSWECTNRQITDTNDPNTIPTVIGASHVFKGNKDITSYCAAVDPTDWTTTNNAGYLPTGLNNYGDNPVAVLALYRGNLVVFNAGGYQMWQIDPDPQNMALLDAQPIGSIWPRAAQSVANDLLILTEVGVRNISTVGATANLAIGNTGQPVDPLIVAQLEDLADGGVNPNATFVLGASGDTVYTGYSNGVLRTAFGTVTPSPVTIIGLNGNTYEVVLLGGLAPYGGTTMTLTLAPVSGSTVPNGLFDYMSITSGSVTDIYYISSASYSTVFSTMGQWTWAMGNNNIVEGDSFNAEIFVETEAPVYQPISLYYPGRGQYWLIFGAQAFVLTMNGSNQKNWSRYIFPQAITDWALNGERLYVRTSGNLVWELDADTLVDDYLTTSSSSGIEFEGVIQWPYLDLNSLAANKMMMGFDLVGDGDVQVQFGYNQQDPSSFNDNANFTSSTSVSPVYQLAIAGTVPGTPVPMPINAPAVTVILTFPGDQAWTWEAFNIYVVDQQGAGTWS